MVFTICCCCPQGPKKNQLFQVWLHYNERKTNVRKQIIKTIEETDATNQNNTTNTNTLSRNTIRKEEKQPDQTLTLREIVCASHTAHVVHRTHVEIICVEWNKTGGLRMLDLRVPVGDRDWRRGGEREDHLGSPAVPLFQEKVFCGCGGMFMFDVSLILSDFKILQF